LDGVPTRGLDRFEMEMEGIGVDVFCLFHL